MDFYLNLLRPKKTSIYKAWRRISAFTPVIVLWCNCQR
jgi:hypothetical protein